METQDTKTLDRQWDIRLNISGQEYLEELIAAIEEHYASGKIRYVLVSGVEIGTKATNSDYQCEHIHIALILHERMTGNAILNHWNVNRALSFYMKPRPRSLPYQGWRQHHMKAYSKKDPNQLCIIERGELPKMLKENSKCYALSARKR